MSTADSWKCEGSIDMPSTSQSVRDSVSLEAAVPDSLQEYRLYKRRWLGLTALVLLNLVAGMVLVWFGPIANTAAKDLGFTLDEVNWLGNVVNLVYLPSAVVVPYLYGKLGIRGTGYIGAVLFIVSGWVRYAGTIQPLSVDASYALIMIGQMLGGLSVPIFQIIVPSYSEKWFDLKGRTTATMIMCLANPVGNALGQLLPPLLGGTKQSLFIMAIIFTAVSPAALLVGETPPTPPTFAASRKHASDIRSLGLAMLGRLPRDRYTFMTVRQRIDFAIIVLVFGLLVGVIDAFTILTAEQLGPYGYSDDTAGLMGAALLLVGLVCAAVTAPLYDRTFTHHLALACKISVPAMAACWLALIWEIKPNNDVVIFILVSIIGATSLSLLPVVLELAVELTRNADASSAVLWFSTNLFSLIFVLAEGAFRQGPDANPPLNMRPAVIFQGSLVAVAVVFIYLVEGKQTRRMQDELMREGAEPSRGGSPDSDGSERGVEVIEVPSEPEDKKVLPPPPLREKMEDDGDGKHTLAAAARDRDRSEKRASSSRTAASESVEPGEDERAHVHAAITSIV